MRFLFQLSLGFFLFATSIGVSYGTAVGLSGINSGFSDTVDRIIGWQFTVGNKPVSVNQLGVFDFDADGLDTKHQVGIWSLDQSLIVSGIVQEGTIGALEGAFRYVDVAKTQLQANTEYVIGATWPDSLDPFVWDQEVAGAPGNAIDSFSVDSRIALAGDGSARFNDFSLAFAFPTKTVGSEFSGDPRRAFWGPNFTIVPEPSTFLLALLGIAGLKGYRV